MDQDSFEIVTDVKRVASLTEQTTREMFLDDVGESAIVYLDGQEYYAEIRDQKFTDGIGSSLTLTIDEAPPATLYETNEAIVTVAGGEMDWALNTPSLAISDHPKSETYGLTLHRVSIELLIE